MFIYMYVYSCSNNKKRGLTLERDLRGYIGGLEGKKGKGEMNNFNLKI